MIKISKLAVGQLRANCYIVFEEKGREAIIIDPGDEAEFIIKKISELEVKPRYIVATHGHFDHVMAVNELKAAFKISFLLHEADEKLLKWMRKSAVYFTKADPGPAPIVDKKIAEGDELIIGKNKLRVIEMPGHTPGGVCLYCKNDGILFSGDTIFADGAVGRWDFPYASKAKLEESVRKLTRLPEETIVYPGHGEETTIGEFQNFYLRQKKLPTGEASESLRESE